MTVPQSDYQIYNISSEGFVEAVGDRMAQKLDAIPIPEDLTGKAVLDVGCDFGFWSFLAANRGAAHVLGLDRNRPVKGHGQYDLISGNRRVAAAMPALMSCSFESIDIGKEWQEFGSFDLIFLFSLYHHIYENCGDHQAIFFWLFRHCVPGGVVLWENPVNCQDIVAKMNISKDKQDGYTLENIIKAAAMYFDVDYIGPAIHEPHRRVYKFTRRDIYKPVIAAKTKSGYGGASKAFQYAENRRCKEVFDAIGIIPYPGSLNVDLAMPFGWDRGYYRAQILDVSVRGAGFDVDWLPRWARFYPVLIDGKLAYAFRFEGENYPEDFAELIADQKLRDLLKSDVILIQKLGG